MTSECNILVLFRGRCSHLEFYWDKGKIKKQNEITLYTPPKYLQCSRNKSPNKQAKTEQFKFKLVLHDFKGCPFCALYYKNRKVRIASLCGKNRHCFSKILIQL